MTALLKSVDDAFTPESKPQPQAKTLLSAISEMAQSLQMMRDIIQKANFIALNASIEAARTQSQSENFTLVADQVRRQAERTDELALGLDRDIKDLLQDALRAMAVNLTDIANDVIDKIDRNLFERNCDMQAWASFSEIIACAKATQSLGAQEILAIAPPESLGGSAQGSLDEAVFKLIGIANRSLGNLVNIYQVYSDSFVVNDQGIIVASARNHSLIGKDVSNHEEAKQVKETKHIYVTDMALDPLLSVYTVTYNAPIKGTDGEYLGFISNRFNWKMAQDILLQMPMEKKGKIFVINKDAYVIADLNNRGLLKDSMHWLDAGTAAMEEKSGYTIECARNGQPSAWGFCHTFGYNAYPGKAWSAIVMSPLDLKESYFLSEEISRESDLRKQASSQANESLKECSSRIQQRVSSINSINNETNMLAVNAAIQAGVAGAEGEAFSVIASEIGQLARQSEEFVHTINTLTQDLGESVRRTIYTRLGEAAFDCMDKIDRNLFERNCDVQAFAAFSEIKTYNTSGNKKEVLELLRRLHEIYEVYHDIFLLDLEGNIVSAAIHRELMGQNQADRSWFREAVAGNLVVTDLYSSRSINDTTMAFSCPVRSPEGAVIGVLTTRFNCQYIYDIMGSTIVGKGCDVYLVNSKGTVIGSPTGEGVFDHTMAHLKAFRSSQRQPFGYTIETDEGGHEWAIGFARTSGYLNYPGKSWTILIRSEVNK